MPIITAEEFITEAGFKNSSVKMIQKGTILMAMYGQGVTRGRVAILDIDATINQACAAIVIKENVKLDRDFLYYCLMLKYEEIRNLSDNRGGNQANLNAQIIRDLEISLPPLSIQHEIVAALEQDRATVEGAKALAMKMAFKIKGVIDRVWGKEAKDTPSV